MTLYPRYSVLLMRISAKRKRLLISHDIRTHEVIPFASIKAAANHHRIPYRRLLNALRASSEYWRESLKISLQEVRR